MEQIELERGQLDRLSILQDFAPRRVDAQPLERQRPWRLRGPAPTAPEDGTDAGGEFARAERLGDVVVRADREPDDFVRLLGPGREHHHVDRGGGAQLAEYLETVQPRKHDVQHDDIRMEGLRLGQCGGAVRRRLHLEPVAGQIRTEKVDNAFFIIYHKDFRHVCIVAQAAGTATKEPPWGRPGPSV